MNHKKNENEPQSQVIGGKDYEKVNIWLAEKSKQRKIREENLTPSQRKTRQDKFNKLVAINEATVRNITFYGKVVDQNNNPIPNADIHYSAGNAYLAQGTGKGSTRTNNEGVFKTEGVKGTDIGINHIRKEGYEFKSDKTLNFNGYKRFSDSMLWEEYSKEGNPYIFTMSKIGKYARVINQEAESFSFIADGREYTLDLKQHPAKAKKEGKFKGDLRITFSRDDEQWSIIISAIEGGLQETSDLYMNKAPEVGYQESYEYSGLKEKRTRLEKKFYFTSRNGENYGLLNLTINPYLGGKKKKSGIQFHQYVLNLEGGRDLGVPPKAHR